MSAPMLAVADGEYHEGGKGLGAARLSGYGVDRRQRKPLVRVPAAIYSHTSAKDTEVTPLTVWTAHSPLAS